MKRIFYYVIAVHVLFVLWSALWMPSKRIEKKPLQVRMVVQAPPPQAPVVKQAVQREAPKAAPPAPAPSAAKPKPQKVSAPSAPPAAIKAPNKTAAPKAAPVKKEGRTVASTAPSKPSPVVPENLVRQLQESIAKIDQKSHKDSPREVLPAPKWIPQLKIDEEISVGEEEGIFVAQLVQCLQQELNLPEIGSVKIELVLKCDGSFVQMKVIHSESQRNKTFLEQELRGVQFPPFSGNLKNEKEHAFTITFCNI